MNTLHFKGYHAARIILIVLSSLSVILLFVYYFSISLPTQPIEQLPFKQPAPLVSIFTQEGDLIAKFKYPTSHFIALNKIPDLLIKAVIATEDQRFWQHLGVDIFALLRASLKLLITGQKAQGGSTITMQVVRNYYLTPQKTFLRKLKEIILAIKLEKKLTKQQILELYLNKVYMGQGLFGVGAAADFYIKKPLHQLHLAEIALLAGLPKAPSLINPMTNSKAAKQRRDFVLHRMFQMNFIEEHAYQEALQYSIDCQIAYTASDKTLFAPYIPKMVQDYLNHFFKRSQKIENINVYTTINTKMQKMAERSIQKNLLEYDQRHGYQGPEKYLGTLTTQNLPKLLYTLKNIPMIYSMYPALVVEVHQNNIVVLLANGSIINIVHSIWGDISTLTQPIIQRGSLVRVQRRKNQWILTQIPKVEAALIALDPTTGAIRSLSGGFSYVRSQFNRAIHATRQPGSAFKPFIYAAALEKGYTLADLFNDAPLVFSTDDTALWRPKNVNESFRGLVRFRVALVDSINLVTVRILRAIGISYTLRYVERFGFQTEKWPKNLTLALGSGEVSLLEMAQAYSVFANGGYRIMPYFISHMTDENGQLLYAAIPNIVKSVLNENRFETKYLPAPRVMSTETAFLMHSALQDVVRYGTAQLTHRLKRLDLAGKTGTTNHQVDSSFTGYNKDLVTSVWVGYDQPRSLKEYAYTVAVPLWANFMANALRNKPEHVAEQPITVQTRYINPATGKILEKKTPDAIQEYFDINHQKQYDYSTSTTEQTEIDNDELQSLF